MNPTKNDTVDSADVKTAKPVSNNTLTVTDNRTGKQYEVPIKNDTIRAARPAPDQGERRRFRDDELRSGLHQHGLVHQQDHLHRRRHRHPALPRLFHRRSGGKKHVSRNGLPDSARRAAHRIAAERLDLPHHASHLHSREHQEISRWLSLRRPPDGHADFRPSPRFPPFIPTRKTSSMPNRARSRPTA